MGQYLDVTRGVEAALDELRRDFPASKLTTRSFDRRPSLRLPSPISPMPSCSDSRHRAPFLFEWRGRLISVIAIPVSLVAAGLVLYLRGTTINTMVLAGLVVALGAVVDDAIIDIENIVRRLRENRAGSPKSVAAVVFEASLEIRRAIFFATMMVIVVAVAPRLRPRGLVRRFLRAPRAVLCAGDACLPHRGNDADARTCFHSPPRRTVGSSSASLGEVGSAPLRDGLGAHP